MIRGTTQSFGDCFIPLYKRKSNVTWLASELQASNGTFNGVQSLSPDVSKLYCVLHMKQRDEIKIGKFLAKFKCSENEKVFKAKQEKILAGKNLTDFAKLMLFYIRQFTFPSKLCTSFFYCLFSTFN